MANEWIRKDLSGGTVATTLNGAISGAASSIVLTDGSTYPDGSAGKFVICIDRGLATEEKILITSRSGNTLTVSDRGYDGTAAQGHSNLAPVEHVFDAFSLEQSVAAAAAAANTGSMSYRSAAFAYAELAIGATGLPIVSNGSVPTYAGLGIAGLSATVQGLLVPAGMICSTIAATAPTGWLFLDGSSVAGADVLYPALWAIIPAGWKSGTTLVLPDARGRVIIGAGTGAGLTNRALSSLTGAETVVLAASELPAHTHTVTDPGHSHAPGGGASGFMVFTPTGSFSNGGGATANSLATTASATTGITLQNNTPSGGAHANMQPSLALNHMVKVH